MTLNFGTPEVTGAAKTQRSGPSFTRPPVEVQEPTQYSRLFRSLSWNQSSRTAIIAGDGGRMPPSVISAQSIGSSDSNSAKQEMGSQGVHRERSCGSSPSNAMNRRSPNACFNKTTCRSGFGARHKWISTTSNRRCSIMNAMYELHKRGHS